MRQRNHCSSLKGIPKMKLQDSGPSGPKSLQSQNRPRPENRLSISRLDVVHAQLTRLLHAALCGANTADGPIAKINTKLKSSGRDRHDVLIAINTRMKRKRPA